MIFGRGDDYIDYTLLKKKGLLKMKEEQMKKSLKTEGGFIDFSSLGKEPTSTTSTPSMPAESSMFNPLANFDAIQPSAPSIASSELSGNVDAKEINALKIKIDDLDYKINNFIEKLDKIEEKLNKIGQS